MYTRANCLEYLLTISLLTRLCAAPLRYASQVGSSCIVSLLLRSTTLQIGPLEATSRHGPRPCGSGSTRNIVRRFALVAESLCLITRGISQNTLGGSRVLSTIVVLDPGVVLRTIMICASGSGILLGMKGIYNASMPLRKPLHRSSATFWGPTVLDVPRAWPSHPFLAVPRGVRDHRGFFVLEEDLLQAITQ